MQDYVICRKNSEAKKVCSFDLFSEVGFINSGVFILGRSLLGCIYLSMFVSHFKMYHRCCIYIKKID